MTTITEIITAERDFAAGVEDPATVAQQWAEHGFAADDVQAWLDARCFDPDAAAELRDAGITPEQASTRTDAGTGGYADTIGYKVANGDLGIPAVRDLLMGTEILTRAR